MFRKIGIIIITMILFVACFALGSHSTSVAQALNPGSGSDTAPNVGVQDEDLIFADGFESGDFSAWSKVFLGGGDLSISSQAALAGNYGMQANINDATPLYVRDYSPVAERTYHARFYFDPNGISITDGNWHAIFYGYNTVKRILMIEFGQFHGEYKVRTRTLVDAAEWVGTPWYTISDHKHCLEIAWLKSTAPGANNGSLTMWVDGIQSGEVTSLDNDNRGIVMAGLGAIGVLTPDTHGIYYFDDFESRRYSYIGMSEVLANFSASPTVGSPALTVNFTNSSLPLDMITSYLWDFGDGITSTETSPVHSYLDPGLYTVSLTVFGTGGHDTLTKENYVSVSDTIFADGFESGDFSAWSASVTGGGDLSITGTAALVGSYGMQAVINDNTPIYVRDDTPNAESHYRARFYFDPNSIAMANNDMHSIFYGYAASQRILGIDLRMSNGVYKLHIQTLNDTGTWASSILYTVSDDMHYLELDWQAATADGANDGSLTLWIDGVQSASLSGLDNDTKRIEHISLGAVGGIDPNTRGTYYFDAFESRRSSYIGP